MPIPFPAHTMDDTAALSKYERRRQQRREIQEGNAALLDTPAEVLDARPRLSSAAMAVQQALPADLIQNGAIEYDARGQPKVALYDPRLLASNPQRGRVVDRRLDELAASLRTHGQQEPILARLITEFDRRRWPEHFTESQLLLILKGHRVYFANAQSNALPKLRVELLLPLDGEAETEYGLRAFRRASIKMMHSEAYTILDKVNLYQHWTRESALDAPSDTDAARHFEISRDECVRLRIVSQLDDSVAQEIANSDRVPADEIIYQIANRPAPEQQNAWKEWGTLTVTELRKQLAQTPSKPNSTVSGTGRPRNFTFAFKDERFPFTYIGTDATAKTWQQRGGARAFLNSLKKLLYDPGFKEQLTRELG